MHRGFDDLLSVFFFQFFQPIGKKPCFRGGMGGALFLQGIDPPAGAFRLTGRVQETQALPKDPGWKVSLFKCWEQCIEVTEGQLGIIETVVGNDGGKRQPAPPLFQVKQGVPLDKIEHDAGLDAIRGPCVQVQGNKQGIVTAGIQGQNEFKPLFQRGIVQMAQGEDQTRLVIKPLQPQHEDACQCHRVSQGGQLQPG